MKKAVIFSVLCLAVVSAAYSVSFNRIIYPIDTKDASGYVLHQDEQPMRIISASPAVTELLFAFNIGDRVVGVTGKSDYPDEAKKIEKVGGDRLDTGKMLRLQPDLVIVNLSEKNADLNSMRKMKFTQTVSGESVQRTLEVFAVDPKSLRDVIDDISTIGTITNREHAAYSLTQRMMRSLNWVEAKAKTERSYRMLKALVIVSKGPVIVASDDTFQGDLLRLAGLVNVAPRGASGYVKMERKDIEKADPDVIIAPDDLAKNPKDIWGNRNFRKTEAGKNKRAVCIESALLRRPGPRITQALEKMAAYTYGWSENTNEQTDE